ncbi:MAG: hypothetical protein GQ552_01965 [Flavobacteriaceae bacterium]|nr:hypothetical protein [Flavobacteriaceae bacterium]
MKLSKDQIAQLYTFTRQHFVEWYDLQTELVDHLANDIEQIWKDEPNLSFDQAKNKAFKKFGIFGFSDVIEKKQNALYKYYWKMVWGIFKDYLKLPKVILTMLITLVIFTIINTFNDKKIFIYIYLTLHFILILGFLIHEQIQINKKNKTTGKKWMFDNIITSMGGVGFLMYIQLQVLSRFTDINWSVQNQVMVSTILALFSILSYILIIVIPKKLTEKMTSLYPQYKLLSKVE